MKSGFVWFHHASEAPKNVAKFYETLLGWTSSDGPPGMTMLALAEGPFAALGAKEGKVSGWVPYVQVDDVEDATSRATKLGAEVLQQRTKGPAGDFTIVRDPGGAQLALWQKA